jgi:hypothetical protein
MKISGDLALDPVSALLQCWREKVESVRDKRKVVYEKVWTMVRILGRARTELGGLKLLRAEIREREEERNGKDGKRCCVEQVSEGSNDWTQTPKRQEQRKRACILP